MVYFSDDVIGVGQTFCACARLFTELVKPVLTASQQKFQTLVPFPKIAEPLPTQQGSCHRFLYNFAVGSPANQFRASQLRCTFRETWPSFQNPWKMTNRHSSWMTSSVPRPTTAFSSPSLGRLSDIKTRLSFR